MWASDCRILARRLRRPRCDASPLGHRDATSARERDTDERGRPGREWRYLPDSGQSTLTGGADRVGVRMHGDVGGGGSCRIADRRLTLTGGADRVGGRVHGDVWAASTCRIAASLRSQAGPIVWASGCRIHVGSPCRIAGKRLTLTGGADRVGGRVHGDVWAASTCRIAASLRSQAGPIVWASGCRIHVGSPCRIAGKRLTLTGGADRVGVRMPGDVGREWSQWRPVPAGSRPSG